MTGHTNHSGFLVWSRLKDVWHQQGSAGIWFGALARTFYRRMIFFERWLDEPVAEHYARAEAEIRELAPEDQEAFGSLRPEEGGLFLQRLARGDRSWGVWCEGQLRHVFWVAVREAWIGYLERWLPLGPHEVYTYGLFTHPQWRGLGLSAARTPITMTALRGEGFERVLTAALPENRGAFPTIQRAGYRRIGVMGWVGVWRWRWHFYRPDAGSTPPWGLIPTGARRSMDR